jgi:hypothetical protein
MQSHRMSGPSRKARSALLTQPKPRLPTQTPSQPTTSSFRPKQQTVSPSVAQWRNPRISLLFLPSFLQTARVPIPTVSPPASAVPTIEQSHRDRVPHRAKRDPLSVTPPKPRHFDRTPSGVEGEWRNPLLYPNPIPPQAAFSTAPLKRHPERSRRTPKLSTKPPPYRTFQPQNRVPHSCSLTA